MAKESLQEFQTIFDNAIEKAIEKTNEMSSGMSAPSVVYDVLRELQNEIAVRIYVHESKKAKEALKRAADARNISPSVQMHSM